MEETERSFPLAKLKILRHQNLTKYYPLWYKHTSILNCSFILNFLLILWRKEETQLLIYNLLVYTYESI